MLVSETLNAIIEAAKNGDTNKIKDIFTQTKQPIDLNFNGEEGYSPLFYAVNHGHLEVVKTLVLLGAKPAFQCRDGIIALHSAAYNGAINVVGFLLSRDPGHINMKAKLGHAAVDYAIAKNDEVTRMILAILILSGANLERFSKEQLLIDFVKFPWAAKMGVLDVLLRQGTNINARHPTDDYDALMAAAAYGCSENVDLLLRSGVDVEARNSRGQTAIAFAQGKGFEDIAQKIMDVFYQNCLKDEKTVVLQSQPKAYKQTSPSCGFFAAFTATQFHFDAYPERFTQPLYAPEKKYRNKGYYFTGDASLRSLRKKPEISIDGIGEIFTDKDISKVVSLNQCSTKTVDINSYSAFIREITIAISSGLPVDIPYSASAIKNEGNKTYSGKAAHWAVIWGYKIENNIIYLYIAENGSYTKVPAEELYDRFYNIENKCDEIDFYKIDVNALKISANVNFPVRKEWVTLSESAAKKFEGTVPRYTVHKDDLSGFRRKLTIVYPPKQKNDHEEVEDKLSNLSLKEDVQTKLKMNPS